MIVAVCFWFSVAGILYTYAFYPVLLFFLSRFIKKRVIFLSSSSKPVVTLLIAAYNEEEIIASKLKNCLQLDFPRERLQILVAADGSNDRTAQIVESFADQGIELSFSPERRGKMAAVDRAMQMVRGEIVVMSDANNLYDPQTLLELVKPFSDPEVGLVTGAKTILRGDGALGESEGFYWKYESFVKKLETRLGSCTSAAGEIMAFRRSLYQKPPEGIINDDFYILMQVLSRGFRAVYAPLARSYERVSATAADEVTRRARIVAGRYQAMILSPSWLPWRQPILVWQVISHKFLRPLVPFGMIGALLANIVSVAFPATALAESPIVRFFFLTQPFNWIILTLQLIFYGEAIIAARFPPRSRLMRMLYLPAFLVNSNLAALKGLYRFLTRQQSANWQRVQRRTDEV